MPLFRITIVELTPRLATTTDSCATGASSSSHNETKVFEQTLDDLNLRSFVRQINATPRRRKAAKPQA